MTTPSVKSFRAVRKLKLTFTKRDDDVHITKAGSHCRARFHGQANFVFGASAEEAKQRLLSAVAKNLGIVATPITKFEKQLLEACR
jgi:hypothetical protein